jgi:hypothetical protein
MGLDHVDPLSGNLLLAHTDLALPGNAGLDLRVTRYYNSNVHRRFAEGVYTYEEPSWVGVGWRLHFGRVLNPDSDVVGARQIEMPDGSRHPVYQVAPGDPWWRSADFFLYNPSSHVLKLPNGLVYTFGHVSAASDGGELGSMRYVTEIRDPFDNTLTFSYFAAPGPTGGVQQIQQDLGSGQVRTVTFTYDPDSRQLGTMTYNGRTWEYFCFPSASSGYWLLRYVRVPRVAGGAVRQWTYYYGASVPGEEMTLMKTPSSAEFQYAYDTVTRTADIETYPARVVWRRTVPADWDTPAGTWDFSYDQGDALNETHVQGPGGRTVYRYDGIGTAGPFNVWRTGTLTQQSRFSPANVELERESFTYVRSDALIAVPVGDPTDPWYDDAVYRPLVGQRTIVRDPGKPYEASWTTFFDYHWGQGTFNDYGQPFRIWQWPYSTAREIRRTFVPPDTFTPYIVGRVATEDVRYSNQAGQFPDATMTWRDYAYDPATGFMTRTRVDGVATEVTRTSRGNVATSTNAREVTTSFEYAWGAVSRIETPLSLTVRTIPGPDPVATSETTGKAPDTPLTTTYTYDSLGRLSTVTPPGSSGAEPSPAPSVHTYDDASAIPTWTALSRGYGTPTVVKTFTDVYGRVRRTEQSGGSTVPVKSSVTYDAEGRETFRSGSYTGETVTTRGTRFAYDALDRVTQVISGPDVPSDPDYSATTYAYTGVTTTVTDPKGYPTTYQYAYLSGPGDGRLLSVTDAKHQVTQYEYRLTSTLTKATGPGCAPGDETCTIGAGPVRTWTYNTTTNRLSEEQHPESGLVQYSQYDAVGNATEIKKRRADGTFETMTLTYDALNRPLTRSTDSPAYGVSWTYDTLGRTTSVTGEVTTTYGFDAGTGRPNRRSDERPGQWAFTSVYVFDGGDRLSRMTYRPYSRRGTSTIPTTSRGGSPAS